MRKLTKKDTPFLRKTLEWWTANFPFSLDHTQLITWAEQFPDSVVEKSLSVTADWYVRQKAKSEQEPSTRQNVSDAFVVVIPTESDVYRYATACMRNIDRARATAEK